MYKAKRFLYDLVLKLSGKISLAQYKNNKENVCWQLRLLVKFVILSNDVKKHRNTASGSSFINHILFEVLYLRQSACCTMYLTVIYYARLALPRHPLFQGCLSSI